MSEDAIRATSGEWSERVGPKYLVSRPVPANFLDAAEKIFALFSGPVRREPARDRAKKQSSRKGGN